jgi:hypothetical protein
MKIGSTGVVQTLGDRKRKAARRQHVKIDVSSGSSLSKVIADDVSCLSTKAICGFRTVIRHRWTHSILQ